MYNGFLGAHSFLEGGSRNKSQRQWSELNFLLGKFHGLLCDILRKGRIALHFFHEKEEIRRPLEQAREWP